MRYYVLLKRKGSKKWLGAIPSRKGVSLSKLRSTMRKTLKKGFIYKIVSETQLRKILLRTVPKKIRRFKRRKRRR